MPFQYIHKNCINIQRSNFRTFLCLLPKMNLIPGSGTPHSSDPSSPKQSLIYFLFLRFCLFWTFHMNRIVQTVFCVWFLSPSIMFIRFIHFGARIRTRINYLTPTLGLCKIISMVVPLWEASLQWRVNLWELWLAPRCVLPAPRGAGQVFPAFGPSRCKDGVGGGVYLSAVLGAGQDLAHMLLLLSPPS